MKKLIMPVLITIAMSAIISCAREQVRDSAAAGADNAFLNASNKQLAKYPVTGFAYKSTAVPDQQWKAWARSAAPVVKDILNKLPEGYMLEVRGHADASGPEHPEGDKPGNMNISRDRAKAVIKSLESAGIATDKITYKGAGSSELLAGFAPRSGQQRRVTFSIVPQ